MRGKWLLAAGVLILMGAVAGLWTWYREGQPASQAPAANAQPNSEVTEISGSGQIRAHQVESIAPPVEGRVDALLVEVGQQVFAGQQLASIRSAAATGLRDLAAREAEEAQTRASTLETQMLAARLEAARARAAAAQVRDTYERAEREYKRQEMLQREGATPRLTFEKAQAQFQQTESEFRSMEELARQADDRLASIARDLETARRTAAFSN
jgi:HlyD family secretion protein